MSGSGMPRIVLICGFGPQPTRADEDVPQTQYKSKNLPDIVHFLVAQAQSSHAVDDRLKLCCGCLFGAF